MKKFGAGLLVLALVMGGGFWWWENSLIADPKGISKGEVDLVLEKYDFDNLRLRDSQPSQIEILGPIKAVEDRRENCKGDTCVDVNKAGFATREIRFESNGKKVSGMINYHPEKSSLSPVIIMIRGYADTEGYYPGSGSWRVADKLAESGYATISLDFLGYGNSDLPSDDILEARFEKVPNVLDLIEAVKQLPWVDKNRIGIWAHSNGGQIALSVLEAAGAKYPTVLWAPMTNPFPQSVLETIDLNEESGRVVAARIDEFEKNYDVRRYAFENYYHWIRSPVLIQQGTADVWCQVGWQQSVVEGINSAGGEAELIIYNGDDHNLSKSWLEAVERDVEFYKKALVVNRGSM